MALHRFTGAKAVGGIAQRCAFGNVRMQAQHRQNHIACEHAHHACEDGEQGGEFGRAVDVAGEFNGKRGGNGARHQAVGDFRAEVKPLRQIPCAEYARAHAHHYAHADGDDVFAHQGAVFINRNGKRDGDRAEQPHDPLRVLHVLRIAHMG